MTIKGFIETSMLDWDGKLSTVVFFNGCNLRCGFCHNQELLSPDSTAPTQDFEAIEQYLSRQRNWIDAVCFTGGEPTLSPELLKDCLERVGRMGFLRKLDTNGTRPTLLAALIKAGLVEYVAMDYKTVLEAQAIAWATGCGASAEQIIADVRRSMAILESSGIDYEYRTTVIPDPQFTDHLESMAVAIATAPRWYLQRLRPQNSLSPRFKSYPLVDDRYMQQLQHRVLPIMQNCYLRG